MRLTMYAYGHWQEAFLTARSTFASSLAAFSVCSYIAGVGDRHTENFLVRFRLYPEC